MIEPAFRSRHSRTRMVREPRTTSTVHGTSCTGPKAPLELDDELGEEDIVHLETLLRLARELGDFLLESGLAVRRDLEMRGSPTFP